MSMSDSGKFGPAMRNVPNSLYKGAKKPKISLRAPSPLNPKYTAKNIRTRLSNLADKMFFNQRSSK